MAYESTDFWALAIVTVCYQLSYFFIAYFNKFDKVTDFAGGSNFAINAILSLVIGGNYTSKTIVATVCVIVWALRLAIFLLARVLKAGDDKRFDGMREDFFKFLGFWIFQIIWVYTVGISLTMLNASGDKSEFGSATDIAGLAMFIIGFLIEVISDQQKFNYRFNGLPRFKRENPGKTVPVYRSGLWNFSRQPNYFGEIFLWWGIFVMCLHKSEGENQVGMAYISLISPIVISLLLLFLSGIPLAEKGAQERYLGEATKDEDVKKSYLDYRKSVSPLIPMPKFIYRNLPMLIKRVFLFEFAIYETELLRAAISQPTLTQQN